MDTIITRKSKKNKYLIAALLLFLILSFISYFSFTKKQSLNVKRGEIIIKTIESSYFEDFIVFQAKVEPLNSMLINVIEGGAVQEIFVENGAYLEQGQPLVKLYNPNTELGYVTQETSIIEQINNLNKARLDIRNQELNLAKDLVAIEHDYIDAKNNFELNKKLFEQEILSKNEWKTSQENYRFQQERKNIIQESIKKEKQTNQVQIAQINQSIAFMQKSLGILRTNKKNFLVSAPLSGRLSSFEPILGKTYSAGESIGKIDVMSGYKLIALVDEYYLARVSKDQKGNVEYKNEKVEVIVSKVLPEVKNGRFQVELIFVNNKELDLRQGLSFGVQLILSEKTKTKVVSKGSFYQETAGKWIFVIEGNKAVKRNIKRFPEDFMFQLTKDEFENLKFQFGISSWGGTRRLPYAFTE